MAPGPKLTQNLDEKSTFPSGICPRFSAPLSPTHLVTLMSPPPDVPPVPFIPTEIARDAARRARVFAGLPGHGHRLPIGERARGQRGGGPPAAGREVGVRS